MMKHLSPREFVEAVEDTLHPRRLEHLQNCRSCREKADDLSRTMGDVRHAVEVPDPSPLFWNHFSRRVQEAINGQAIPSPRAWWREGWRPLAAIGAAACVLAVLVMFRAPVPAALPAADATSAVVVPDAPAEPPIDDASLNLIAQFASTAPVEELRETTRPTSDATAAVIDHLTQEQLDEFARLIKAEMGGLQ